MKLLEGKVSIVTGAARGIGAAIDCITKINRGSGIVAYNRTGCRTGLLNGFISIVGNYFFPKCIHILF